MTAIKKEIKKKVSGVKRTYIQIKGFGKSSNIQLNVSDFTDILHDITKQIPSRRVKEILNIFSNLTLKELSFVQKVIRKIIDNEMIKTGVEIAISNVPLETFLDGPIEMDTIKNIRSGRIYGKNAPYCAILGYNVREQRVNRYWVRPFMVVDDYKKKSLNILYRFHTTPFSIIELKVKEHTFYYFQIVPSPIKNKWLRFDNNEKGKNPSDKISSLTYSQTFKIVELSSKDAFNELKERIPYVPIILERDPRSIPASVKKEVWERDGGKCARCGSTENLQFDHVIPVSKGGNNTSANIQLLCKRCNLLKSQRSPGDIFI